MTYPNQFDLKAVLESIERDYIITALRDTHGNKAKAARALGLTERLIGIRVRKLGINWRAFRTNRAEFRSHLKGDRLGSRSAPCFHCPSSANNLRHTCRQEGRAPGSPEED